MDITFYFIPAFLATLLTFATGCSMVIVFDRLGLSLFKSREVLARAMYFITGLLVMAWLLLLAGMAGVAYASWVGVVPWCFVIAAIVLIIKTKNLQPLQLLLRPFSLSAGNNWDRVIKWGIILAAAAFFVISLAPPTDADSLDYHLGVPAEVLKTGNLYFDKGHLNFRMFGFGEMLNLPGVAAGCPQLGAFIQYIAFLYLLALYSEGISNKVRIDVLVLSLGAPVLMFLISSQKHQLTGVVATALAFYTLLDKGRLLRAPYAILFWAVLAFAVGIKYSFIISAAAILLLVILKEGWGKHLLRTMLTGGGIFLLFNAPVYVFKAFRFGDPVSPLLERFRPGPDPVVLSLQQFLHDFMESPFPFPANLFLPSSPGSFTTIIGLPALILVLFLLHRRFTREKIAVIAFAMFTVIGGQPTARFFLEPLLWIIPLFAGTMAPSRWQVLLFTGLRLQLLVLLPVLLLTAGLFLPGLITNQGRDTMMSRFAIGYSESRWIDASLPRDAKICVGLRSRSLIPREHMPVEYTAYYMKQGGDFASFEKLAQQSGADYYVVPDYAMNSFGKTFNRPPVACKDFTMATRNPLNKTSYTLCIYKVNHPAR